MARRPPDPDEYYRILGLPSGASLAQVRQAYRDLAMVWHPDRFPPDSRLRQKAEAQMKLLNEAYGYLQNVAPRGQWARSNPPGGSSRQRTGGAPRGRRPPPPPPPPPNEGSAPPGHEASHGAPRHARARQTARTALPVVIIVLLAGSLALLTNVTQSNSSSSASAGGARQASVATSPAYANIAAFYQRSSAKESSGQPTQLTPNLVARIQERLAITPTPAPTSSFSQGAGLGAGVKPAATEEPYATPIPWATSTTDNGTQVSPQATSAQPGMTTTAPISPVPSTPAIPASPSQNADYFTLGSTKDEVLAVQGSPSSVVGADWSYGWNTVCFSNGLVSSYANVDGELKARLIPESDVSAAASRGYFTLGSTKDEVLAVQGSPSSVAGAVWSYGFNAVHFKNGRVSSCSNIDGTLRVRS